MKKRLAQNIKTIIAAITVAIGLTVVTAPQGMAQDVSVNKNDENSTLRPPTQIVTTKEARLASANGIVLHFGNDISESNEDIIKGGLKLAGYEVETFRGGPLGHVALCINEKCGDRNFNIDAAHRFLISVLNDVVPEYRNP